MIVAALLLQVNTATVSVNSIYQSSLAIYNYMQRRGGVKMIMQTEPDKKAVVETCSKLGFQLIEINDKQVKSRVKAVNMEAKRD